MAETFVPLFLNSEKNRDTTFFSIHNRPSNAASTPAFPAPIPASHSAPVCATPPKVRLERNGDVVTKVIVECGCGQVIELACQY